MAETMDYYKALQVDIEADADVIEAAYKKLCKRYHPDVSTSLDSIERMKTINIAYETLKDPVLRKRYDYQVNMAFKAKRINPMSEQAQGAQRVLNHYFKHILTKNYKEAYTFISSEDKLKMSVDDFSAWQTAVSRVYDLKKYLVEFKRETQNVQTKRQWYAQTYDFIVLTEEHNYVIGRVERDYVYKRVLLENQSLKVYMGYETVSTLIQRFENLIKKPNHATRDVEMPILLKALSLESQRYVRHGRPFSAMLLRVQGCHQSETDYLITSIRQHLRELDTVGIWREGVLMIVLPETTHMQCKPVSDKLRAALNAQNKACLMQIAFGEYKGELKQFMMTLERKLKQPS